MRLSEIIGQDIPLVKRGSDRYYTSPVHDSLIVDNQRNIWRWYSRDKWGNAAAWLRFWRGLSYAEARNLTDEGQNQAKYAQSKKKLSLDDVEQACANLHSRVALEFLYKRGIGEVTAEKFRLGYTRGKIVIPHFDPAGKLMAIRYRLIKNWVTPDGRVVRYFSEPGSTASYPYLIWDLPRHGKVLFLVEGEFKALILRQLGYFSLGTQGMWFRREWVQYLRGWDRVIYLRDTRDLGGIVSANRVKKTCPRVEIYRMPNGHKAIDDFYVADESATGVFLANLAGDRNE